jgi:hypothetical protein
MPGLGALLTDDQVASALTYVRREGGWLAPAVSPDAVRHVRALTADRSTAWTDEELWAIDR